MGQPTRRLQGAGWCSSGVARQDFVGRLTSRGLSFVGKHCYLSNFQDWRTQQQQAVQSSSKKVLLCARPAAFVVAACPS